MAFIITLVSLFCYTCELETTRHFVVTKYGCMNKGVGGVVNLVQIHEHKIQMFVGKPLAPLSHH